ncbi:MAG: hypothetical protein ACTSQI_14690 [Candidatus Helarchaeota archaeon]
MPSNKEEPITKEHVIRELKESVETKLVNRREAPLLGLICFSLALWGSKIFTSNSPGTSLIFNLFGAEIHFHHFHYGIIALVIGIIIMFIEGPWPKRIGHILFGAGLGFIVDEYWLLLTFDDSSYNYFSPESQLVSKVIGIVITAIYIVVVALSYFLTKRERKIWIKFYEAVESGKIKINL